MTSKMKQICPLCKMAVDQDDTYTKYRNTSDYNQGIYPRWAYVYSPYIATEEQETMVSHFINFHRLSEQISAMWGAGLALSDFLKDHPNFELGITIPKISEEDEQDSLGSETE